MSMYTSDVAEQVVKMTLDGTEVALKYAGAGGKKLLAGILALLRETNKSSGKIWLSTMLKSGKEIKIVAVKDSEVLKFRKEAEAYGITYVLLKNKSIDDGVTDIMIKADDMSRVNRSKHHQRPLIKTTSLRSTLKLLPRITSLRRSKRQTPQMAGLQSLISYGRYRRRHQNPVYLRKTSRSNRNHL